MDYSFQEAGRGRRYFDFKNHFLLEWQCKENKIQCELWIFRFYCQALIFSPRQGFYFLHTLKAKKQHFKFFANFESYNMEPVLKMTPFCKNFCIAEKFSKKCNLKGFDFHKLKIMLFAVFQNTTNNVAYFFETLGFQQKILSDV